MGEVWRARDTRLGREVALKFLPEGFATDPERHARFEREAKLLAALNHPNIAGLYSLEHLDGQHALAMELIGGEGLDERLARGPIPVDEAVPIALQVAEALEVAHERGIVHRDLKPANVKVRADGAVKVLDFGLAKAWDEQASASDAAFSPTITGHHTRAGVILGTAAYMSPEQARGKAVDKRADIWAFGVVVFEMLTGRRAFEGEEITDVLAAVLRQELDWSGLPADVPPRIRRLLDRCLDRDPRRRLRDIGEARLVLAGGEPLSATSGPAPAATSAAPAPVPSARRVALPWALAAVLAAALAAVSTIAVVRGRPANRRSVRSYLLPPDQTSFAFDGPIGGPELSPDGTRLAFVARDANGKTSLWVRPLDSQAALPLAGTEGASYPFWSPDGRYVGFFVPGKLKKIDASSGPPETVCAAASGRGGSWSRDGVIVFAPDVYGGLERVSSAGGTATALPVSGVAAQQTSQRWPVFLPDGRHFLFWAGGPLNASEVKTDGIYVGSLEDGASAFLEQADSDAVYAPPGYLLFLRDQSLMAQPFDASARKLTGEAFPIAEQVANPQNYRRGCFTASDDGTLAYQTGDIGLVQAVWVDGSGRQVGTVGEPRGLEEIRLSPDGLRMAEQTAGANSKDSDIWIVDLARGVRTKFTFGSALHIYPVWSPDGERIAYTSNVQGHMDLFIKSASGAGDAEPLVVSEANKYPTDWSPDARFLAVMVVEPGKRTGSDIWVLSMPDRKFSPFLATEANEGGATFSPDDRWLAYQSNASGRPEIYVTPFPTPGGKWQVSQDGGVQATWRRDGKGLYFRSLDGKLMEAAVAERGSAVEVGTPHELFQAQLAGFGGTTWVYAVAPSGDRFLLLRSQQNEPNPLSLVTNWTAGLQR
jgi:Tol biopolymer transport system component/tRNA A-37 threonylcarbamoyl transferase component Bud32